MMQPGSGVTAATYQELQEITPRNGSKANQPVLGEAGM
jgi:hypothetical protein